MRPKRDRNTREWNNGVGIDRSLMTLRGDLNHLIQPVIGILALEDGAYDGEHGHLIDRLYHALELADEFLPLDQTIATDGEGGFKMVDLPRYTLVKEEE